MLWGGQLQFHKMNNELDQGEKRQGDCMCERKWPTTVLGLGILTLGIIGVTVACVIVDQTTYKYKYHYGLVLDGGSSHTDITIYRWPSNYKNHGTAKVEQIGFQACSNMGISGLRDNPSAVITVVKDCVEPFALDLIPSKEQSRAHLYFGATGGMRLLCDRNQSVCQEIMHNVNVALKDYKFSVSNNSVRVLTGQEEAIYGWISANILTGALTSQNELSSETRLVGALDLGGGSLEISFLPNPADAKKMPLEYRTDLALFGQQYTLYRQSYQCYGLKEIERRLLAKLVEDSGFERNVTNPCYPSGFELNVTSQYLWLEPCSPKPAGNIFPQRENYTYLISGGSSYSDCKAIVSKLFNQSGCDRYPADHCSFNGVYQPPVTGKFLAFAGFAFVAKAMNISVNDSIQVFDDKAKVVCSKNWTQVQSELMYTPSEYRPKYCFDDVYIYGLLTEGFHFRNETADVHATSKIDDSQVSWSLGFMVNATNLIPNDAKVKKITTPEYIAILAASGLISLVGLTVLSICCYKNRRKSGMGYKLVSSQT